MQYLPKPTDKMIWVAGSCAC